MIDEDLLEGLVVCDEHVADRASANKVADFLGKILRVIPRDAIYEEKATLHGITPSKLLPCYPSRAISVNVYEFLIFLANRESSLR
jgi:hypothetical protein